MFNLTIENKDGQRLDLTNEKNCVVVGIDGLTPPSADIATSAIAMNDGTRFNSATVNQRNIVIRLQLIADVENTRILLYRYFRIKQYCKIFYKNSNRDVYCEGYIETFENDRFAINNQVDISIICPSPWFKTLNEVVFDMSQVLPMFEFPFDIEKEGEEFSVLNKNTRTTVINSGDIETGIIMELRATSDVVNPRIYNADTNEMIGLNFEMQGGDVIRISTVKGSKYVRLIRDGVTSNIINALMKNPVWFQVSTGETPFTYDCTSGNDFFSVQFTIQNLFEGV